MKEAGALLVAVCLSGCGTVVNLTHGVDEYWAELHYPAVPAETRIYGGIQNDYHGIRSAIDGEAGASVELNVLSFLFFTLIDFPLSLAADTVTLLYTVPYALTVDE